MSYQHILTEEHALDSEQAPISIFDLSGGVKQDLFQRGETHLILLSNIPMEVQKKVQENWCPVPPFRLMALISSLSIIDN